MAGRLKVLIVEDGKARRREIEESFGAAGGESFEVEFISTARAGRLTESSLKRHAVMIDLEPDPDAAIVAAWRIRSIKPYLGIAVLAPSEDFRAPVEMIDLALGPLVVLDGDGISSLPSLALTMAEEACGDAGGASRGSLRKRHQELRDITNSLARQSVHLIQLRNDLASEKNKMETIINSMTDGMIYFNVDGAMEVANPVAARLFPGVLDKDSPSLRDFSEVLGIDRIAEYTGAGKACEAFEAEIGSETYRVRLACVTDSGGENAGMLMLLTDITQDKKYEKLKSEFTSMISHELRTPLTSIRAAVDNLVRGNLGTVNDSQRKFLGLIARNVDRQQELIDNLLDLARLENNKMELRLEMTNPAPAVIFCVDQFSLAYKDKGVKLDLKMEENLPEVTMDQGLISQAMNNLLSNALKFTDAGGEVSVRIGVESLDGKPFVSIAVEDTGIGIPQEHKVRIFDKYTQADSSIRRRYAGTGLGLAICKEIAKAHKGRIDVESEPGKGSRFILRIPVISRAAGGLKA